MSDSQITSRFATALDRLRADPEAIPPSEKRELIKSIADVLRSGGDLAKDNTLMFLLSLLAKDKKGEVRQDVAEMLVFLPDEEFVQLTAKLLEDSNRYVRIAAEASMGRRDTTEKEAQRASRGVEQVSARFEAFAKRYGDAAAAEAIRLSEQQFDLLAQSMTHDLLNLLTPVKDYARWLQNRLPDDNTDAQDAAEKIIEGLEFLQRSIRDVETYCQPLAVERHMEPLEELVRRASEMARKNLQEDGYDAEVIDLSINVPGDIQVFVSRRLIILALMNVIANAYQACLLPGGLSQSGKVTIKASFHTDTICITVADTGIGLSEENLRKLKAFLPGRKNMNKNRSTGYGLLIAKRNIEAHDGNLDIASLEGHGTTVTISLPLKDDQQEEP